MSLVESRKVILRRLGRRAGGIGFDGTLFVDPTGQAAIQDGDAGMAIGIEEPCGARGGEEAEGVVEKKMVVPGDAEELRMAFEGVDVGQHVAQLDGRVGDGVGEVGDQVMVEQPGARQPRAAPEVVQRRAPRIRQMERAVQDPVLAQAVRLHLLRGDQLDPAAAAHGRV